MPPGTTCSPTSKDTTIVSGSIPPSGISPPNRQSAKPLNPVSAKSGEGQLHQGPPLRRGWKRGTLAHGIGRTKGGRNTKSMPSAKGRPCVLLLTSGLFLSLLLSNLDNRKVAYGSYKPP